MPVVECAGGDLYYETAGDGDPVVFVHGGWVSSRMWAPQVERFAGDRQVVTVDIRGHGATGASTLRRYSVDLFAGDLRVVLERLDITDPVVCGLSLGGLVAKEYAAAYEDEMAGIVLVGTTQTIPPVRMTRLQKHLFTPKSVLHATIRAMGVRTFYETLLGTIRQIEGHRWVGLTPAARSYVREEIDRFSVSEYIKVFDALYDYRPIDVSDLDVPALVISGDHEAASVVRQSHELATALDAEHRQIPNAGHLANLDNPDVFDAYIAEFLAS